MLFQTCMNFIFLVNTKEYIWLHFILIVTLDILLIISNFSTTCQVTVIRVLVYYSRLSVVRLWLGVRLWVRRISLLVVAKLLIVS